MAIDFLKVRGNFRERYINIIRKKTTLKRKEIILFYELFIFFLKKYIIEHECIAVDSFGAIALSKRFKQEKILIFKNDSKYVAKVINGIQFNDPNKHKISIFYKQFNDMTFKISKCLNLGRRYVLILIGLFFYTILEELRINKQARVRGLGLFYLREIDYSKWNNKVCGRVVNSVTNTKQIMFNASLLISRLLNNLDKEIKIKKRTKRLLQLNGLQNELIIKKQT